MFSKMLENNFQMCGCKNKNKNKVENKNRTERNDKKCSGVFMIKFVAENWIFS